MSWSIDRTIKVVIKDDPELITLFVHWVHDSHTELIFDAVMDGTSATMVFHHEHFVVVRDALVDLSAVLHRSPPEDVQ